jgi:O-acetyl-ADP-ribose deacetylase (regulator of RNase III)
MKYLQGDLLENDWDAAFHCANTYCVMGSGVAYFLKKKWPSVFEADLQTKDLSEEEKLGEFSWAEVEPNKTVYNLYAQRGVGNNGHPLNRNCSYDHLYDSIFRACEHVLRLKDKAVIGIPYGMASVRAGGNWEIVDTILFEIEKHFQRKIEFEVYQLENAETTAQSSVFIEPNYITPM